MLHEDLTKKIISVFYEVYRVLGPGFLERVYEEALAVEFGYREISFGKQVGIGVCYKTEGVGDYIADFLVDSEVIVEVKAKSALSKFDEAQVVNYLKATGKSVGLLVNFCGEKLEYRRIGVGNGFVG